MIYNSEPIKLVNVEPENPIHSTPLPKWGRPILELLGKHYFLEVNQLNDSIFGSGNRTGRKKFVELFQMGYLSRYELYCEDQEKPIIGYSLTEEGVRVVRRYSIPVLSINKAQEYIIANEFLFMQGHLLDGWKLLNGYQLLIGEIQIDNLRYGLWAPREEETRIKSLLMETQGLQGLVVIVPKEHMIMPIVRRLEGLPLTKPAFYTTDDNLEVLYEIVNGQPVMVADIE